MIPAQRRALVTVACAIGLGCALVAVVDLRHNPASGYREIVIGLLLGTMFGQTTLAAAWNALGPLPRLWRLPLSLAWVGALVLAFAVNLSREPQPIDLVLLVQLGGCLLVQWLIVQMPLWVLVLGYSWQLRPNDAATAQGDLRFRQFGIRQLMVLTAIVAVLFGLGRALVLNFPEHWQRGSPDTVIIIFLAVAAILTTLPLVLAALLPRGAIAATIVIAVLIGLATLGEEPLFRTFGSGVGGPGLMAIFASINAVTGVWICLVILGVRLSGYGLSARGRSSSPKA